MLCSAGRLTKLDAATYCKIPEASLRLLSFCSSFAYRQKSSGAHKSLVAIRASEQFFSLSSVVSQVQADPRADIPLPGLPEWHLHQHHPHAQPQTEVLYGE